MDDYDNNSDIPNMDADSYGPVLVDFLTHNPDMKKAAVHSMRQGLYAGGGAVTGGLLLGPVGGLLGGIVGSLIGFWQADDFDGVVQQIGKLERTRQQELLQHVRTALVAAGASSATIQSPEQFRSVLVQFAAQKPVRDQIWKACVEALGEANSNTQELN